MPRFKIERSLSEPIIIEVEGGQTFESVPLSPALIRELQALEDKKGFTPLERLTTVSQQVALIFGVEVAEIEKADIRVLNQVLSLAMEAMISSHKILVPPGTVVAKDIPASPPVSEEQAEKNASKPGAETSQ
jgi:hypothetical protein